jgi:hypothetical protein
VGFLNRSSLTGCLVVGGPPILLSVVAIVILIKYFDPPLWVLFTVWLPFHVVWFGGYWWWLTRAGSK